MSELSKIGWYTTFGLPSDKGNCNYYGCKNKATKNGFCDRCGKIEIKVGIVDNNYDDKRKDSKRRM